MTKSHPKYFDDPREIENSPWHEEAPKPDTWRLSTKYVEEEKEEAFFMMQA